MAFDGNGNWIPEFSAKEDRDAGVKILASRFDDVFQQDLKESFEKCLTTDGQNKPLGNFNLNNQKIINVGDPSDDADSVNLRTLNNSLNNSLNNVLNIIYPVGSLYIGTQNTCPMASLIAGSTWTLVAQNRALWGGNGTNANTLIEQGLPQHTHPMFANVTVGSGDNLAQSDKYVAKGTSSGNGNYEYTTKQTNTTATLGKTAGANYGGITVGGSTIVQPPAYRVNVWRRTS